MSVGDPIKFKFTYEVMRGDKDGECMLTLRVPATDWARVAMFAVLREFVFDCVATPVEKIGESV